jgi:hypothetical protein
MSKKTRAFLAGFSVCCATIVGAHAAGMDDVNRSLMRGDGASAISALRPLAEKGDPQAQTLLGLMLSIGQGVAKDPKEASQWYLRAAEQGSVQAQHNLADMYADGVGVEKDYKKAALWYAKAAERNDFDAQYKLGGLYELGSGVQKSTVIAYALFSLSASTNPDQGNPAAKDLQRLSSQMKASEIDAAKKLESELSKPAYFRQALDKHLNK